MHFFGSFQIKAPVQSFGVVNAIAERINGILKYEFGLRQLLPNLNIAKNMVKEAVEIYNNERLHWSLSLKTPEHAHRHYNQQKIKRYGKEAA